MFLFRYLAGPALLSLGAVFLIGISNASAQPMAFQGFENPGDVACWLGSGTITRVPSGGGTLHLTSFDGNFHAEITNMDDDYLPGFGDSRFTEFCLPPSGAYQGDFSQSITVYIFANWTPAKLPFAESFWIDESPRDSAGAIADGAGAPSSTYTAEHNFRLTATGTSVKVGADNLPAFATITQSGWYTFQLTWRKDPIPSNPVISDFNIYGPNGTLFATTTNPAFMVGPAPPLPSSMLGGAGYLWFTVWQNGFANDILAIDDARVGGPGPPMPPAPPTITKAFSDSQVEFLFGSTALTLTITNPNTNIPLTGVSVTDPLPTGLTVAVPSNSLMNTCGGTVTAVPGSSSIALSNGTVAANSTCTVTVRVNGSQIGVQTNTTTAVTSNEGGAGNTATATISVVDMEFLWFFLESGGGGSGVQ